MFDADMALNVSTWLGATTVTTSWEIIPTTEDAVMSGINSIQTTLTDMQTTLNTLAGETTPTVIPTVLETSTTGTIAE